MTMQPPPTMNYIPYQVKDATQQPMMMPPTMGDFGQGMIPSALPQSQTAQAGQDTAGLVSALVNMQNMQQARGTGNGAWANAAYGLNKAGFGNAAYSMLDNSGGG